LSRNYKCRCSKCYKELYKKPEDMQYKGMWENIEVIEVKDDYVLLECRRCGHRYYSNSKAAHKLAFGYHH